MGYTVENTVEYTMEDTVKYEAMPKLCIKTPSFIRQGHEATRELHNEDLSSIGKVMNLYLK